MLPFLVLVSKWVNILRYERLILNVESDMHNSWIIEMFIIV